MAETAANGHSLDIDDHTPTHSTDERLSHGESEIMMEDPNNDDIADLETSIISQSRTIDDFTRIIAEWRTERERTSALGEPSTSSQNQLRVRDSMASLTANAARSASVDVDAMSQYSYEASSVGDPDDVGISPSQSHSGLIGNDDPSRNSVRVRCTCCCGRGTRKCKRARRATREWSQMESDLRLAAQIGQALLRRSDSLQADLSQKQEEHGTRIDSIMKKLTSSIKEATQLEKRLEQSDLNLEACEASNRALVRELEESRRDLAKTRGSNVRNSGLEVRLERAEMEVEDLRQELTEERRQAEQNRARLNKAEVANENLINDLKLARLQGRRTEVSEEERTKRREEVRKLVDSRLHQNHAQRREHHKSSEEDAEFMESLVSENDTLILENKQMKALLESRNEEVAQLREELSQKFDFIASPAMNEPHDTSNPLRLSDLHSTPALTALSDEIVDINSVPTATRIASSSYTTDEPATPSLLSPQMANVSLPSANGSTFTDSTSEADAIGSRSSSKTAVALQPNAISATKRETRTAQLNILLDMIQRLSSRLSTADVDTLTKRLQRQKLAGDVGHLARTTVNGILRDVDGLRDHFRRAMDNEMKGREQDNISLHSRTSGKSNEKSSGLAESDSLVARKEFFALIKVFKDLFVEMARLRNAVNEVSMQPQHAARILQEQLGVQMGEEKGVSAWFGRLLSTTGLPGTSGAASGTTVPGQNTSSSAASGLSALNSNAGSNIRPNTLQQRSVTGSSQNLATARSSAAVLPSAVAVEVKGMHASEQTQSGLEMGGEGGSSRGASPQPDHSGFDGIPNHARFERTRRQPSLSRVQSRNLSGLFVGSMATPSADFVRTRTPSEQIGSSIQGGRLSRIVDDDEVSIHHHLNSSRARTLRPRNLSDSSMHTTYLDDEPVRSHDQNADRKPRLSGLMASATPTPAAISRILTPSTLSLRAANQSESNSSNATAPSTSPNTGVGLLGSLVPTKSVAKAFGSLLSGGGSVNTENVTSTESVSPTTATASPSSPSRPPKLRARSSKAQLALAAATVSGSKGGE